jgi:hypothetical protein
VHPEMAAIYSHLKLITLYRGKKSERFMGEDVAGEIRIHASRFLTWHSYILRFMRI